MLIYGTTVPTEMNRQRNRGVLGVERKLTINKENHGRVYAKPWFSFIYRARRHSMNDASLLIATQSISSVCHALMSFGVIPLIGLFPK